jgi:hypothetical protein
VRLPVQLRREPAAAPDPGVAAWYAALIEAVRRAPIGRGEWHLATAGDHRVHAWWWTDEARRCLVAVNYSHDFVGCRVPLPGGVSATDAALDRLPVPGALPHAGLDDRGLAFALEPWQARILDVLPRA